MKKKNVLKKIHIMAQKKVVLVSTVEKDPEIV